MTVYVDDGAYHVGRMIFCHMGADTLEELHAMAEALRVRRWFQRPPDASWPHYDIGRTKRAEAIRLGAQPITQRQMVRIRKKLLKEWSAMHG